MPMPSEYALAQRQFDAFMAELQEELSTISRNIAYTTLQSVFIVFRRRLSVAQAIDFAQYLPPILRAIFVSEWNPAEPLRPWGALDVLDQEVKTIRQHHNFSKDGAIAAVSTVLWRHVDAYRFRFVLERLGPQAKAFWANGASL